jgi:hypothetical protein
LPCISTAEASLKQGELGGTVGANLEMMLDQGGPLGGQPALAIPEQRVAGRAEEAVEALVQASLKLPQVGQAVTACGTLPHLGRKGGVMQFAIGQGQQGGLVGTGGVFRAKMFPRQIIH